jgi:hypothetical protein
MTDIEKLEARIKATEAAILATRTAANLDRKMSHDKHMNGHFTKALTELSDIHTGLCSLRIRMQAVGR